MVVTHTIVNRSDAPAPVAVGAHPYLAIGDLPTSELTVRINASTRIFTDEHNIPVSEHPVEGVDLELTQGRLIGDLDIDRGFGGVHAVDGTSVHSVTAPGGRRVELWAAEEFGFAQVFIPHNFAAPDGARMAIAIEPMTAPANALNSGKGLRWLDPDETWTLSWGIRLVTP
jgi:aldose 1-epimerase